MTHAETLDEPAPRSSYAARAFFLQYNLILLGGSGLFSLASASPLPLVAFAGAELLWLLLGSNLGSVRRWLDRREIRVEEPAPPSAVEPAKAPVFDRVYQQRVNLLEEAFSELRALAGARPEPTFQRSLRQLDGLRASFHALCESHQGTTRFLEATPEAELASEVERLQQALAAEHDLGAKMGIRQALVLARRRVEQRHALITELTTLALRIETIERAVAHLVRQGRTLGGNAQLGAELDALVAQIGPATVPRA
jgi:hypothetical protein